MPRLKNVKITEGSDLNLENIETTSFEDASFGYQFTCKGYPRHMIFRASIFHKPFPKRWSCVVFDTSMKEWHMPHVNSTVCRFECDPIVKIPAGRLKGRSS